MDENEELIESVKEKIKFGNNLLELLEKYRVIDGKQKLQRKINQEIKFLKKVWLFFFIKFV